MQQTGILKYQNSEINCIKYGIGKKLAVAFHGLGSDATFWSSLADLIDKDYTVIAIDLPGFGKTIWREQFLTKTALVTLVERFKEEFKVEKLTILGYSIGAKLALTMVEQRPEWIDKLLIFAADGLKKNFWYKLATRSAFGKALFERVMNNPELLIRRINSFQKIKIVPKKTGKFVKMILNNEAMIKQVHFVWPNLSQVDPELPKVRWNIKKENIPTDIFLGDQDQLFNIKDAKKFAKGLPMVNLHILENKGHKIFNTITLENISNILKK